MIAGMYMKSYGRAIKQEEKPELSSNGAASLRVVVVDPKCTKGPTSYAVDCVEKLTVKLIYHSSSPLNYLPGNFAPVPAEAPPATDLPIRGHFPARLLKYKL